MCFSARIGGPAGENAGSCAGKPDIVKKWPGWNMADRRFGAQANWVRWMECANRRIGDPSRTESGRQSWSHGQFKDPSLYS